MTAQEAQRILAEAAAVRPAFIRGDRKYVVQPDGRVNVWNPVGRSGLRWKTAFTVTGDTAWLPADVRERVKCEPGYAAPLASPEGQ